MGVCLLIDATTIKLSVILVAIVVVVVGTTSTSTSTSPGPGQLSLPGCPDKCDNVDIPYPFRIGKSCHYNQTDDAGYYAVTCNDTYHPSKLELNGGIEVLQIVLLEGNIRVSNFAFDACYGDNGTLTKYNEPVLRVELFTISASQNVFVAIGCDTYALFSGLRDNRRYGAGCATTCAEPEDVINDVINGTCFGNGCCQTAIPDGIVGINRIEAMSINNHTKVSWFNRCSSAFVVAKDALNLSLANLTRVPPKDHKVPVVMDWMIGRDNCSMAQANGHFLCNGNTSICDDSETHGVGYRCNCLEGYSGNPYIKDDCKDVNECVDPQEHDCEKPEYCVNTIGNYICKCPKGFHGRGRNRKNDRCVRNKDIIPIVIVGEKLAQVT